MAKVKVDIPPCRGLNVRRLSTAWPDPLSGWSIYAPRRLHVEVPAGMAGLAAFEKEFSPGYVIESFGGSRAIRGRAKRLMLAGAPQAEQTMAS